MVFRAVLASALTFALPCVANAALTVSAVNAGSADSADGRAYSISVDSPETLAVGQNGGIARAAAEAGVNRIFASDDGSGGYAGAYSLWGANFHVGDSLDGSGRVQVTIDVRINGSLAPDPAWPVEAAGDFEYYLGAVRGRVDGFTLDEQFGDNPLASIQRTSGNWIEKIGLGLNEMVERQAAGPMSTNYANTTTTRMDGYYDAVSEIHNPAGDVIGYSFQRYYPDHLERMLNGNWVASAYPGQNSYAALEASFPIAAVDGLCDFVTGCLPGTIDQTLTLSFDVAANSDFFLYGLLGIDEVENAVVDFAHSARISGITVTNTGLFTSETPNLVDLGGGRYNFAGAMVDGPAVPEPASWALMIAGFGLVGGSLRRRRIAGPVPA